MLPPEIEAYRDHCWQRDPTQRVETVQQAEAFVERVGFTNSLTDSRKPGPSLYVTVCGRRDAVMPRNVQKDAEASLTWVLKDDVVRRGKVYYSKLARGRAMFVAPRIVPYFYAVWGIRKNEERNQLSAHARSILKVLRKEYESASIDLRNDSGITDRKEFAKAFDELQAAMIVIPSEVVYEPKFTYIWTLAEIRFPTQLKAKIDRQTAFREIARCFLESAGMTVPGELAKVTGLSRPEAGLGNQALVKEGFAISPSQGTYVLANIDERLRAIS
ncbi:MAG: hypothetical protein JST84_03665 [Acidobacteria bacterium]|nr:hypothetical protein [Acidobacteriota bacterium]